MSEAFPALPPPGAAGAAGAAGLSPRPSLEPRGSLPANKRQQQKASAASVVGRTRTRFAGLLIPEPGTQRVLTKCLKHLMGMKRRCNVAILRAFIGSVVKIEKEKVGGKPILIHIITNGFEIETPNRCWLKGFWPVLSGRGCGGVLTRVTPRGPGLSWAKVQRGGRASSPLTAVSLRSSRPGPAVLPQAVDGAITLLNGFPARGAWGWCRQSQMFASFSAEFPSANSQETQTILSSPGLAGLVAAERQAAGVDPAFTPSTVVTCRPPPPSDSLCCWKAPPGLSAPPGPQPAGSSFRKAGLAQPGLTGTQGSEDPTQLGKLSLGGGGWGGPPNAAEPDWR